MSRSSRIAVRRTTLRNAGPGEYAAKREGIIRIAAEIFREKGFHSASINDIAEEAGIDRASLYYYASGKDELFREVIFEATVKNVDLIEGIAKGPGSPLEKVARFIEGLLKSFQDQYPSMFVFIQEDMKKIADDASGWAKEMRGLASRFDQALISVIKAGLADGSIRPVGDARLIAFGIIGMLNWSHRWYRPDRGYTAEEIGRTFAGMIVSGLAIEDSSRKV